MMIDRFTWLYIFPIDRHPFVAIRGALLMIKAQCVHQLVHDHAMLHASRILQIHHLAAIVPAYQGPTSRRFGLYSDVIDIGFFVGAKTYARVLMVILYGVFDHLYIFFVYDQFKNCVFVLYIVLYYNAGLNYQNLPPLCNRVRHRLANGTLFLSDRSLSRPPRWSLCLLRTNRLTPKHSACPSFSTILCD